MAKKTKLSYEEIKERYLRGDKVKDIAEAAGISYRGVTYILTKMGVKKREFGERPREYKVNEDFFKSWSAEMAWVLGLLYTDGYIVKRQGVAYFTLVQKDTNLLYKVRDILGSEHKLILREDRTPALRIGSKEMVNDLIKLGLTERKSLVVDFPEVPKPFLSHFVRGVIDGDGWVQDRGYVMNVTTGSVKFAKGLLKVFLEWGLNAEIKEELTETGKTIYRVWVNGKDDIVKLAEIIYKDCSSLYVKHKRERMEQRVNTNQL